MILQIAGYGFVGMAHALSLSSEEDTTVIYDPAKGYGNWRKDMDALIVCVSTPQAKDGSCNMENVYNSDLDDVWDDVLKKGGLIYTDDLESYKLIDALEKLK